MKRTSRQPSNLSKSVHLRLNSYALAASAAGVGALALTQPAEAKIVYTRTYKKIVQGLPIDLNHDGITDFSFSFRETRTSMGNFTLYLNALTEHVNEIVTSDAFASALPSGVKIGPQENFSSGPLKMIGLFYSHGTSTCAGPWLDKKRYLGLKFDIKGKTHYGWAKLGVWCNQHFGHGGMFGHLKGFAYETVPNKPIIAGKTKGPDVITVQPASLGHLAHGASAIPAWRAQSSAH
jgi:hypothetical protein